MNIAPNRHTILIVDDEKNILEALKRILQNEYEILLTSSAKKGLELLKTHPEMSLIICDQRMPTMTGVQMFEKARMFSPHAIRMLLTGYSDIEAVIDAINKGQIYRYLTKPWENETLKLEIKKALEYYDLQETIREQNEKLKTLDKAKDQFLMLISHELKTPLTTILSFTESYLRGLAETKEEKEACVGRIHEGALRLQELIDETIDLVSAQAYELKPQKINVDLEKLLHEIILEIHEKAIAKKITIENTIKNISLKADPELLRKNFLKILSYAVNAADEETHIWISSKKTKDKRGIGEDSRFRGNDSLKGGNDYIRVEISYHGNILSPLQRQKIFEPFLIVGDILRHTMGTGLGLPMCRAIVEAHGGTISISSTPHGMLFEIKLPI